MSEKYRQCGNVKLVTGRDGNLHIIKCTKLRHHEDNGDEEHRNKEGDRWKS